jgi:hypothetical protein
MDENVICPYNKAHLIRKERMQAHLVKCRRSYGGVKVQQCKYNATHMFTDFGELAVSISPYFEILLFFVIFDSQIHEKNCSDKLDVYRFMYREPGPVKVQKTEDFVVPQLSPGSDDENWDNVSVPYLFGIKILIDLI